MSKAMCGLLTAEVYWPVSPRLFQCFCNHRSYLVAEPLCRVCGSIWEEWPAESGGFRKRGSRLAGSTIHIALLCFIKGLIPVLKIGSIFGASVVLLSFCPL